MSNATPMMKQYLNVKKDYPHCLLFFRLGDFYELFFDDALIASKELDITLTGKDCGMKERAPMCGVPFHAASGYISKLIEKGYKVAVCEQMEDAKAAKGIVKREVVRVVTPGTQMDQAVLDETKNNYILCVYQHKTGYGIAACDVTTGEFLCSEIISAHATFRLIDEIAKFTPAEIICNGLFMESGVVSQIYEKFNVAPFAYTEDYFNCEKILIKHFQYEDFQSMDIYEKKSALCAAGSLLKYLKETQKTELSNIIELKYYTANEFMLIDLSSRKNLEITETLRERKKKGSLLWAVDKTKTAMGARLLRKWLEQPLINKNEIQKRLEAVEELKENVVLREDIKEILKTVHDFERIMSKIVYGTANARDLYGVKNSLKNLPLCKHVLSMFHSSYMKEIFFGFDELADIYQLIDESISDNPPFSVREGGLIKEGFDKEIDKLKQAKNQGAEWILELEAEEREKTGVKNLKIRFNKIFGYYIELTKSNIHLAPASYIRKQTLANCERYITPQLKEFEDMVLGADEKIVEREYVIFSEIRKKVADEANRILHTAYLVSLIDVLQGFAENAEKNFFVKPVINNAGVIDIKDGRHPVVEQMQGAGQFVSNDTYLDKNENRLAIVTGPNMAGKSTYMRQTALIVLLAQAGSFVPASYASIDVVDRIFTRVGASDDLSSGQSTFMVEMVEVSNILKNATKDSLLILDEIGRGTSTFDGLSIAWSVLEYISDTKKIGARTLFATHYHELTELEGKLPGVINYCISVSEQGEDIVFLRKIKRGGAEHSYGVQVAKLAGLPEKVISRSNEILNELNAADIVKKTKKIARGSKKSIEGEATQIHLSNAKENVIIEKINAMNLMNISPMEALQALFDLQRLSKDI